MSLKNSATFTLSTIVNSIITDYNSTTDGSSSMPYSRSGIYTNIISETLRTTPSSLIYNYSKPTCPSESVTHGFSHIKVIAVMIMLTLFSVFGCLGNGLVIYVFSKKSDKVTSTIFILALAWTDFFTCLLIMPFTVAYIQLESHLYLDFLCKLYQFLHTSNVPLSAFIMVAIAVDRYFSICHPFVNVVTPRRARISIIALLLVAFTLGSITACLFKVDKLVNNQPFELQNYENHTNEPTSPSLVSGLSSESSLLSTADNNNRFNEFHTTVETATVKEESQFCEGLCVMDYSIFSIHFIEIYQKISLSFYIISLLAVFTLYFFIYRSVSERRAWRRKQKSWSHSPMAVAAETTIDNGIRKNAIYTGDAEHLELAAQSSSVDASHSDSKESCGGTLSEMALDTTESSSSRTTSATSRLNRNCSYENGVDMSTLCSEVDKKANRERRDFNFLANIRTAIMLFVVTIVFIVSFLPAWLMATELITFEIIIFYTHFIYNVANPVIYAFMNQSFRKELKRVFQRGTTFLQNG